MSDYLSQRRNMKIFGKQPAEKKRSFIAAKSEKKIAEEKKLKDLQKPDEDFQIEGWFRARRKDLVGTCQCGCGEKSQKKDDLYFRHSIAHIFPKAKFESVKVHPLNFVERAFWGGCHTQMDDVGMDKWPNMADWCDIKAKFKILEPLLTEKEKANKFYHQLAALVAAN